MNETTIETQAHEIVARHTFTTTRDGPIVDPGIVGEISTVIQRAISAEARCARLGKALDDIYYLCTHVSRIEALRLDYKDYCLTCGERLDNRKDHTQCR